MEKTLSDCPACGHRSLVDHCEGGKCGWKMCRRTDVCDLVYDRRTGRGHLKGEPNAGRDIVPRVNWVKP